MSSYQSWEEVKQEFLKRGEGNIMTTTLPIHNATPRSSRLKSTTSVVGDKKQKKPLKTPVR